MVDLPIQNGDFPYSFLFVYQRVNITWWVHWYPIRLTQIIADAQFSLARARHPGTLESAVGLQRKGCIMVYLQNYGTQFYA